MQHRNTAVLLVVFSLVLAIRADEPLKCYQCNSLMNEACRMDPKHKMEPTECTFNSIKEWQKNIQENHVLRPISNLFEIDNVQHYGNTLPKDMACSKMDFKLGGQDVTVRGCQTAKTENIDPCKTIKNKLMNNPVGTVEYCGLCEYESCNGSGVPAPRALIMLFAVLLPILMAVVSRVA